ncbi:MAG: hypothetical protein KY453_00085 [Gemmatimonadetes bacterium]|nr:hypothetical protein [Gemmatimonadota bacterium]
MEGPLALPPALNEASGVAMSRRHEDVVWIHNDSGEPELHAVGPRGQALGIFQLDVRRARDWEDVAVGPCADGGDCLYIGDVGNNYAEADTVRVLRVREPAEPGAGGTLAVESFAMVFDGTPHDLESLFVLPDGALYLVGKGGNEPVTLFRYPMPLRSDTTVTLEAVQRLSEVPRSLPRQVTGADTEPGSSRVVLRTYETLVFHRMDGDTLVPVEDGVVSLRTLRESQGEGVAWGPGGRIVVVSEAGPLGRDGGMTVLTCRIG